MFSSKRIVVKLRPSCERPAVWINLKNNLKKLVSLGKAHILITRTTLLSTVFEATGDLFQGEKEPYCKFVSCNTERLLTVPALKSR